MDNDISRIVRMAGVATDQVNHEFYHYQSGTRGDPQSQFTPDDLEKSIELETDDTKEKNNKKFSPTEDLALVSAWLNVSLDPIISTNQKADKYWERIYTYYNEAIDKRYGPRNVKSLQCRWGKIQRGVNKFCGYYSRLESNPKSGATNHDLITEAKLVYLDKEKCDFMYEHCWNKLRFECKWINVGGQGPVKKRVHLSDTINLDDEETPTVDFVDLDRPPGRGISKDNEEHQKQEKGKAKRLRKASDTSQFDVTFTNYMEGKRKDDEVKMEMAKQHMEIAKQKIEMDKMRLNIDMARVEADKEKLAAKREKEDQAIMMMNLSNMETEMQRQYFSKLQADVFARSMSK